MIWLRCRQPSYLAIIDVGNLIVGLRSKWVFLPLGSSLETLPDTERGKSCSTYPPSSIKGELWGWGCSSVGRRPASSALSDP